MNRILLIIALVLAIVATILGFGWLHTSGDQHVLGFVAAALACYLGSLLA